MAKRENETVASNRTAALPEEGQDNIVVGHVYKEDSSEKEVIPYFVDFGSARVNFAPVGGSAEDQMRTSDFLNRFKYVGPVSDRAEKQVSNEAALKANEAARQEEATAVEAAKQVDRERVARAKTGV